ncbi:MAG: hypothetical protein ACRDK4_08315 [Solirubrobacteraceae bacterium]
MTLFTATMPLSSEATSRYRNCGIITPPHADPARVILRGSSTVWCEDAREAFLIALAQGFKGDVTTVHETTARLSPSQLHKVTQIESEADAAEKASEESEEAKVEVSTWHDVHPNGPLLTNETEELAALEKHAAEAAARVTLSPEQIEERRRRAKELRTQLHFHTWRCRELPAHEYPSVAECVALSSGRHPHVVAVSYARRNLN